MAATQDALREALRAIKDPATGADIVGAGLVEGIELRGGLVQVSLLTDRAHAAAMEPARREVEALLKRQPGITNATAVLTAHKAPSAGAAPQRQAAAAQAPAGPGGRPAGQGGHGPGGQGGHGPGGHGHGHGQPGGQKPALLLPEVKAIV